MEEGDKKAKIETGAYIGFHGGGGIRTQRQKQGRSFPYMEIWVSRGAQSQ
jgi:hypothetical protein